MVQDDVFGRVFDRLRRALQRCKLGAPRKWVDGLLDSVPTDRFAVEKQTEGRVSYRDIYGSAQLDVFGVTNPERLAVAEFQAMMEAVDPNRRITYRAGGRSWFVLSGYLENDVEPTIFYAKFMLNNRGTALSAFEISYPQTDRAEFDPLVERIENSLTSPR